MGLDEVGGCGYVGMTVKKEEDLIKDGENLIEKVDERTKQNEREKNKDKR